MSVIVCQESWRGDPVGSSDRFFLSVFCLDDRTSSEKAIAVTRQLAKKKVIMSLEDRRSH